MFMSWAPKQLQGEVSRSAEKFSIKVSNVSPYLDNELHTNEEVVSVVNENDVKKSVIRTL
jgi:hypothetical protein